MNKSWQPLSPDAVNRLPGQLGVYELADAAGDIVYIGKADARSLFGLRSELAAQLDAMIAETFRVEVTTAYQTRWRELLMAYFASTGAYPRHNHNLPPLGRLSPAGINS